MAIAPYKAEHDAAAGAGDSRPDALKIVADQGLTGKLTGKVALITGCSSGIGVETARALHSTGMDVYMTVRTLDKGAAVKEDILRDGKPGKVELIEMELDSFESIRKGAADFLGKSRALNLLIANAGVMACPKSKTKDGYEMQFGTNHLGHFLLFQLLKDALLQSSTPDSNSRVVAVSSTGHRSGEVELDDVNFDSREYSPWGAYGQSKTANIYFANGVERLYGSKGLHAFSLHPGFIATPLQRHMDPNAMAEGAKDPEIARHLRSTGQGAATTVWAALAKELEGKGGMYLEHCQESFPDQGGNHPARYGYAAWAFDRQKEERLWKESLRMVGIVEEDQAAL